MLSFWLSSVAKIYNGSQASVSGVMRPGEARIQAASEHCISAIS